MGEIWFKLQIEKSVFLGGGGISFVCMGLDKAKVKKEAQVSFCTLVV
jgi:hypothetical protein